MSKDQRKKRRGGKRGGGIQYVRISLVLLIRGGRQHRKDFLGGKRKLWEEASGSLGLSGCVPHFLRKVKNTRKEDEEHKIQDKHETKSTEVPSYRLPILGKKKGEVTSNQGLYHDLCARSWAMVYKVENCGIVQKPGPPR